MCSLFSSSSDKPPINWDVPQPRRRNRRSVHGGGSYSPFYDASKAFRVSGSVLIFGKSFWRRLGACITPSIRHCRCNQVGDKSGPGWCPRAWEQGRHFNNTYGLLTHWDRDKMAAIFQTTFSNAFSWMKMHEFRLRFHWKLFPRVQLTKFQHWFR